MHTGCWPGDIKGKGGQVLNSGKPKPRLALKQVLLLFLDKEGADLEGVEASVCNSISICHLFSSNLRLARSILKWDPLVQPLLTLVTCGPAGSALRAASC